MALIFSRQYYLDFDTTTGQDIKWTLEIWRSYDDADPTPPWVGTETKLVGTGNPIEIEWEKDYNIYKPIIGSKANINLLVQNAGQYADFNDAGPFEYQVRLKYTDAGDVVQDYWTGYMTPLDGTESVSTFPFGVSYTATDGLGLLEQATAAPQVSLDPVKPFDAITGALIQTGLDFPIYLDTGIEVGDDSTPQVFTEALDTVTVSPEWIYDDRGRTRASTYKDQLEGVLSSFNATIKQSNGKWYITNASTYGGTGDNESNTFAVYNVVTNVYVKGSDVTEDLRYNINGTETQELVPSDNDLVLSTRRPYGSIECSPQGFFSLDIENGGFEIVNDDATSSPVGWSPGPTEGPLRTSTNIRQDGLRSLYTPHNTFRIDTINDIWFINTDGVAIDSTAPIEVSFDFLTYERVEDTLLSVGFGYEILFVPDNEYKVTVAYFDITLQAFTVGEVTVQELRYNADNSEWYVVSGSIITSSPGFFTEKIEFPIDSGVWLEESQTLPRPAIYDVAKKQIAPPGPGKLYIRGFFPRAARLSGSIVDNSDAVMDFFIDNISIRNMFANEVTDPTFEAVQDNYTSTLSYDPGLASSTNDRLVQTLFEKDYRRTNTTAQTIETLEQIGTQLKLNDFRSQFKYYEGNLINLTTTPLAPHNKVFVDWASVGYTETASCIINGGRFKVKDNKFEIAMYVPNQATDVLNEYYLENVDLIPMPFPGFSDKRTYTLNVVATTVDTDGVTIPNGLVPVMPSYQWVASPGDKIQVEIALQPIEDMGAASATTVEPAPEHLSDIMYTVNGSNLRVNALLTMPEESDLETLNISGVIRDFTPEANAAVVEHTILFYRPVDSNVDFPTGDAVTETSPITGLPTNYIRTSVGAAGLFQSQQQIIYTIEAIEGRVMTNVQETHVGGSLGVGRVAGNEERMATITFAFTTPGTPTTVDVFLDNTTTNDASGTVPIITKTLTITNNVSGTTIEDGTTSANTTTLEFKGTEGDFRRQNITVLPSSDRYITTLPTPTSTGGITVGTPYESGEDWEIPIEVSIVENNVQPTMTIGGTTAVEPYSIVFNVNVLGLSNAEIPMGSAQHRVTFDAGDFGESFPRAGEESLLVTVQPTGNNVFTASVAPYDILVDINEAAATVTTVVDGVTNTVTRALPEIQFSPGVITLQNDGSYVFPIGGTFPTAEQGGGQYVLDVNIVSSTTSNNGNGGGPTAARASQDGTTVTQLTPGIGAGGGTAQFRVVADGEWRVQNVDITLGGQGTRTAIDGTFSEVYTSTTHTPPLSFTQRGSIGPLSGGIGETIVTLTVDPIGYASRLSGDTPQIFRPSDWNIDYVFNVTGQGPQGPGGGNPALKGTGVTQSGTYGSATIVYPGFTDATLMSASTDTGAENLIFFG